MDNIVPLEKGKYLIHLLEGEDDASKIYLDRYGKITESIRAIQERVEKGAMVDSAREAIDEFTHKVEEMIKVESDTKKIEYLKEILDKNPIVYLNDHGPNHSRKVIEKVSEMLWYFKDGHLSKYESFILLCAIQFHDIGNIYGREDHEKRIKEIIESDFKTLFPDSIEKRVIEKIAMVHGGKILDDKDTISRLSIVKPLFEKKVRKRLLAALLRFGDELADDSSRADKLGIELGIITPSSEIHHYYSSSLHTVNIREDAENNNLFLDLHYEFESDIIDKKFNTIEGEKYLLDEIYDRTLKMERERRYCMRFMRQHISLEKIRVEIIIQDKNDCWNYKKITYTLEENGYPLTPQSGSLANLVPNIMSSEEAISYFKKGLR
ncbi:MAG: hypothetical protein BWX72_00395 [Firmicutes bacterium ADurb.Bin080]|nr:MAG: hypothetical protein BWX72_00395 [Firmicutes bacterium ADurb.Bin080]